MRTKICIYLTISDGFHRILINDHFRARVHCVYLRPGGNGPRQDKMKQNDVMTQT